MISALLPVRTRPHEARLAFFVLFSLLLHGALMGAMPSLSSPSPETELKKPIWVDLVEFPESNARDPASMAPLEQRALPPPRRSAEGSKPVPRQPSPSDPAPQRHPTDLQRTTPDATRNQAEIPPIRDLIPSVQNLLAMQDDAVSPFRALQLGPSQDGFSRRPAETQYELYLLELKQKVERNWRVSLDTGVREGVTVIYVIVADDGSLFSCDIIKPSGMIAHDYEAREAVVQAFPLSPPPKSLLNEKGILPIRFSFHYLLTPPS